MLYVTTRSSQETYTAGRVLKDRKAPDGGMFVPITLPMLTTRELQEFAVQTPAETMASVLNRFFGGSLSGRDVEFTVGKAFCQMVPMPYKMMIGELWRNPDGEADRLVRRLAQTISGARYSFEPGEWVHVAVRIALLAVMCGEMTREGLLRYGTRIDVAVAGADEATFMAAWYARRMGMPIHTIVAGSNGSSRLWELLNRGQIRCGGRIAPTFTPRYDHHGFDTMERLICAACGRMEANRFAAACRSGTSYVISNDQRRHLESGIYVSVVGSRRVERTIPNVYGSYGYILDPYTALNYCAVMDYRAESGAHDPVLLPGGSSPMNSARSVTAVMGISEETLRKRLNLNERGTYGTICNR